MVKSATATETQSACAGELIRGIRRGRWKESVESIRLTYRRAMDETGWDRKKAKEAIGAAKKRLPGILWSGKFSSRANANLLKHSGLLCADLDELGDRLPDIRGALLKGPHVWALFLSPSGDGLKVLFRVPADGASHLASYRAVERYARDLCGVEIDEKCKDVSRMCFVSYDPALYINDGAVEIPPVPAPEELKHSTHKSNGATPPDDLDLRRRIAADIVGGLWEIEGRLFCHCPGEQRHANPFNKKECELHLDGVPTLDCKHDSCTGILAGVNHELRSRIAKAERPLPVREPRAAENGVTPKEAPFAFFDAGRNSYWIRNDRGSWISLNETQFKRVLRREGVSPKVLEGAHVSPMDLRLLETQQKYDVHYAGALAGYSTGIYDMGERRILVTESPRIMEPKAGNWTILETLLNGLLYDPQFDQRPYLYGWLKVGYEALRAGERRPGQGLVLAGEHGCGKSLLQNIITLALGGRSARPYQFMSGLTPGLRAGGNSCPAKLQYTPHPVPGASP